MADAGLAHLPRGPGGSSSQTGLRRLAARRLEQPFSRALTAAACATALADGIAAAPPSPGKVKRRAEPPERGRVKRRLRQMVSDGTSPLAPMRRGPRCSKTSPSTTKKRPSGGVAFFVQLRLLRGCAVRVAGGSGESAVSPRRRDGSSKSVTKAARPRPEASVGWIAWRSRPFNSRAPSAGTRPGAGSGSARAATRSGR